MGPTKDLKGCPGGIGALPSMHNIIKTNMHRYAAYKHTQRIHTPTDFYLSLTRQPRVFTHKNDESGYDCLCPR